MLNMWLGLVGGGEVSTNSLPWIMQAHQCKWSQYARHV